MGPVLGSAVQRRYGHTGVSPVKGHEGDEGSGASEKRGEADRARTVHPGDGEETTRGGRGLMMRV